LAEPLNSDRVTKRVLRALRKEVIDQTKHLTEEEREARSRMLSERRKKERLKACPKHAARVRKLPPALKAPAGPEDSTAPKGALTSIIPAPMPKGTVFTMTPEGTIVVTTKHGTVEVGGKNNVIRTIPNKISVADKKSQDHSSGSGSQLNTTTLCGKVAVAQGSAATVGGAQYTAVATSKVDVRGAEQPVASSSTETIVTPRQQESASSDKVVVVQAIDGCGESKAPENVVNTESSTLAETINSSENVDTAPQEQEESVEI